MDDLNFSHHVSEIPAGEQMPKPYARRVGVDVTPFPDVQKAVSNYADSTNWMSLIGSTVAAKASTAIATKLGSDLGKNPQGDLGIPLTDFDKTMQESYKTQAQATLGIQANKLITDSNLELSKAPRITPDLIAKTNKSISAGLQNIFKHAPDDIRPQLESHFTNLQMAQTQDLTERMVREQKEDLRNNTFLSSQQNTEDAYTFGLKGNDKAAQQAIETTKKLNAAAVANLVLTPEQAKENVDTVRKSYRSGALINQYENARTAGKGEEFLKNLADGHVIKKDDKDYNAVTNNLMSYVNHQDALRSQDEQLRLSKFQTSIAMNPMAPDMASQLQELKANVSPEGYERAQLHYINAVKEFTKQQRETGMVLAAWKDPEGFEMLPEKAKNQGFEMLTNKMVEQSQTTGAPISRADAEVQVAASAGGRVPYFVNSLKNKINSANPQMMDEAATQIDQLYTMNASHALRGLSDSDKSIYTQFKSLRDSLPPEEAAKIALQNANQDPDTQKMNKEKWAAFIKNATGGYFSAIAPTDYALKQAGLNKNEFMNPGIANAYGNLILQKYAAFFQNTNGDKQAALSLVKHEVKENFGYTGVNGEKFMTLHPIEKILGYDENSDVVPFIQQDVMTTLNSKFMPLKESFNKNETNEYWDISPSDMKNKALFGHKYDPIQIKRYSRNAKGITSDTYNVVLIGNSFNWDIALQTESGIRPLVQLAPYLGIATYTPNKKAIDSAYLKSHGVNNG